MRGNRIKVRLVPDVCAQSRQSLFQYDYGQTLILEGVKLPLAYEVHFSNKLYGQSKTQIGNSDGVAIPDEYLITGERVYFWIYLHEGESDGETEYNGFINVKKRAKPTDMTPTPVQQDVITETIAALNVAVAQTGQDVEDTNAAKAAAQEAQRLAETAQGLAETAQTAAETAQGKAEDAQRASETAQTGAETARGKAEGAQTAAEAAQTAAETAQGKAEEARDSAAIEFGKAKDQADLAAQEATKAEQFAAKAGYMFFNIVEGDLIYSRTNNVQVDFYQHDGNLYVKEVS